jgi:hypothetical protein
MATYLDQNGSVIATGTIKEQFIDLLLNDGTRFYSTRSDNYTFDFLKSLQIKAVK